MLRPTSPKLSLADCVLIINNQSQFKQPKQIIAVVPVLRRLHEIFQEMFISLEHLVELVLFADIAATVGAHSTHAAEIVEPVAEIVDLIKFVFL